MFCSKASEYAIRSMIYLASQPENEIIPISKLSSELDISFTFLTKVLQPLTEIGLLESHKGAKGGVKIAKNPDEIHLDEIVKAVSGQDIMHLCATGNPMCKEDEHACPLHKRWKPIRDMLGEFYQETTLSNYKESLFDKLFRLDS